MRKQILVLLALVLCGMLAQNAMAQSYDFSKSPEDFFFQYAHKKDSTLLNSVTKVRTRGKQGYKRLSLHTNVVDWVLTVPNVGLEIDLNNTKLNNRSLLVFGKFNGQMKHDVAPKFIMNMGGVRLEYRKYWRTGRESNEFTHYEYVMLNLHKPDTLYREVLKTDEYDSTYYVWEPYFSKKDSAHMAEYDGDRYRNSMYSYYHNARRFISTRTITDPRNWRAYYIGLFGAFDKYAFCIGKKGEQGTRLAAGATFGWSIPINSGKIGHEGGLDLDLGLNVGAPFAKYERFKYNDDNYEYCGFAYYEKDNAKTRDKWSFDPRFILQDIHLSLVYRFRSIGNKVDLDLVDRYREQEIDKYKDKKVELENAVQEMLALQTAERDSLRAVERFQNDSASWADKLKKEWLETMLEFGDSTQFHGVDSLDYIRLILGRDTTEYQRVVQAQKKEAARIAKEQADSTLRANKIAARDSARNAKMIADSIARDSILARRDSIKHATDSLKREKLALDSIARDSMKLVRDSVANAKKVQKAAKDAADKARRDSIQAAKDSIWDAKEAVREAERKAREAEEWIKNAPQRAKDSIDKIRKDSIDRAKLMQKAGGKAAKALADEEQRKQALEKKLDKAKKADEKKKKKKEDEDESNGEATKSDDE